MRIKGLVLSMAGAVLLTGALAASASAQEERCKNELVKASGKATILGQGRATRLAIDNWQREVRQKYGERFMDYTKARTARVECESASIGTIGRLNKRCIVSGYPCHIAAAADDDDATAGDDKKVLTIQRLLRRAGYLERDEVDGEFGPKTAQAVRRFQRDNGLRVTGEMDERTWARLRDKAGKG